MGAARSYAEVVALLAATADEDAEEDRGPRPLATSATVCLVVGDAGVGSIATVLSALLGAAGYRTVHVASRHIHRWHERIRLNGRPLEPEPFALAIDAAFEGAARRQGLSAQEAVLRAGMTIADGLADSLADGLATGLAAGEGAGVCLVLEAPILPPEGPPIRPAPPQPAMVVLAPATSPRWIETRLPSALAAASTVVLAPQRESVAAAARAAVAASGVALHEAAVACRMGRASTGLDGQRFTTQTPRGRYTVALPLLGAQQRANFVTALLAAEQIAQEGLNAAAVAKAIADVSLPLRFEIIKRSPLVVLDGADDPAGYRALQSVAAEIFGRLRLVIVATVDAAVPHDALTEAIEAIPAEVRIAFPPPDRAVAERVAQRLRDRGIGAQLWGAPGPALVDAVDSAGPRDGVLVFGSLSGTAEARAWLLGIEQEQRPSPRTTGVSGYSCG